LRALPGPHQRKGRARRRLRQEQRHRRAGRRFDSWAALEAHLEEWTREVADQRVHGTTGEVPIERFWRAEAAALRSIAGIPPFAAVRELVRKVQADCVIEVDGNAYSVPRRLIGESVQITIASNVLRVGHAGREVAVHARRADRFQRVIDLDPAHFAGVAGCRAPARGAAANTRAAGEPALLRPLAEYERLAGGGW
jgi:hypothetical protein